MSTVLAWLAATRKTWVAGIGVVLTWAGVAVVPHPGHVSAADWYGLAVALATAAGVYGVTNGPQPVKAEPAAAPVAERLAMIPPADGRRARGLLPSFPDPRDLAALDYLSTVKPPKTLNLDVGVTPTILLNDRIGCCFWAALFHAKQTVWAAAGKSYTPTDAEVLAAYETTGYDPARTLPDGSNPTDQGTEPRAGLKTAKKLGLISGYAQIPTSMTALRRAIYGYRGGVILCWALPADVPEDGLWETPDGPLVEGHATQPYGYTTTYIENDTWAEAGRVYPPFVGACLQSAFAVTFGPDVQPDVNHEAHAADVAKLAA